jgi:hypothetical protein
MVEAKTSKFKAPIVRAKRPNLTAQVESTSKLLKGLDSLVDIMHGF